MTDGKEAKEVKAKGEMVSMENGKVLEFVGKRKLLKESFISEHGAVTVLLNFRNGRVLKYTVKQSDPLYGKFVAHGVEQKLGDETAGTEDVEDMVLDCEKLIERLEKNEWSQTREGGGMAGTSVLMKALVELTGKTVDQVKYFLEGKTQAEKMALRNSARVKPIVERIEADKLAKATKVDTDALLGSLEAAA